ncbi:uncharacterized protein LOC123510818 isoform X2 [Portunus trituberculatus]|uniref:uncharacterized protein LOC123510818 isoform X2 n=1 Tax=Portunus trituberculatus TaxID=210409 RepID=UPI001E1CB535|nr:uncharacterized protein LOC123510818 isoform X2 [Portunus trituberculatus]
MPYKCCVPLCKGNYKSGPKVCLFSFPKEEKLARAWLHAIKQADSTPTKNTKNIMAPTISKRELLDIQEQQRRFIGEAGLPAKRKRKNMYENLKEWMSEGGENNPPGYEAVLLVEALNEPCASPQQPSTPNGHNPSKQLPQNTTATQTEVLLCSEASRCFMEGLGVIEQPPIACDKTL